MRDGTERARRRYWAPRRTPADLGVELGNGLTEAEVAYLVRNEWARSGEDVLWRRTKCGIGMTEAERERVDALVRRCVAESIA